MKFRTHCEIVKGRIDPVPVWDVIFLLMIFLVLSSPFVLQPGFGMMELARSSTPTTATFQNLVVTISRENLYYFNDKPTTFDALRQSLLRAARETRGAELIIKADRQVTQETVVKVMSMAFEVGITGVNLATRPEVPAAGPAK